MRLVCEVCKCDPCDCDWGHNECSEIVIYVKSRSCRVIDREKIKIINIGDRDWETLTYLTY